MESSKSDIVYKLENQIFIWGKEKAEYNKIKHNISFEEAATVFLIDGTKKFEDEEHSEE